MSAVIYTRPPNRLGKLIAAPGGKRLGEAVADASANVAKMESSLVAEVDADLARLREACARAAAGGEDRADAAAEAYAVSGLIAGLAGLCGLGRVGVVAFNLCDLVDRYIEAGTWNAQAVGAHIDTMQILRNVSLPDGSPECDAVLEGLKALVLRAERQTDGGETT